VDFIRQNNLSFAYWSWNPNSSDTGGILVDDWRSVEQPKQQLLSQLLPVPGLQPSPSPNPIVTSPPSRSAEPPRRESAVPTQTVPSQRESLPPRREAAAPSPREAAVPSRKEAALPTPPQIAQQSNPLQAEMKIQSDWQTGFCVEMRVKNGGDRPTRRWQLTFQMNQAAINNSWNGTFIPQGSRYTVEPPEWAQVIQPNQTVNLGFCATKLGQDYRPKGVLASLRPDAGTFR
ncbi:cellulose binding domain-containing protein, partial [Leptolyngbya sp. FACHB-36]|uniref:cellulose binding domain-containing protein n=1 Tax=Leptolyngbya sp. FACHB-36 TaxID=2692808 RepID=UPI001680C274